MYFPGGQPGFGMPPNARGQIPFPQGMPGAGRGGPGFPGMPQGGRGAPNAQQMPPMYGMPPNMVTPGFPGYNQAAYLQMAQAAQAAQAATMGGRGAGRGMMGVPGMPGQMPSLAAGMRGSGNQIPSQGRGAPSSRGGPGGFPGGRGGPGGPPGASGVDISVLQNAPPGQQKQMIGEALYPKIHEQQPELAGKITGMLLEMDNQELLGL